LVSRRSSVVERTDAGSLRSGASRRGGADDRAFRPSGSRGSSVRKTGRNSGSASPCCATESTAEGEDVGVSAGDGENRSVRSLDVGEHAAIRVDIKIIAVMVLTHGRVIRGDLALARVRPNAHRVHTSA
jgi:hypothetical protein